MRITLRPARAEDFAAVVDKPIPHRVKAVTAFAGDKVIGVGGLGYRPDGTVIAFAHITDEFRKYPAAVHRAGRAGMALIRASRARVVIAEADPNVPASARWLLHFGFVRDARAGPNAYVWHRKKAGDVE